MRRIEISIDEETMDDILEQGLLDMRRNLKADYESRKNGTGMAIFDRDMSEDMRKMRKMLKAFDRVIKYCTPPAELKEEVNDE
jgi:hypothetical protein